VQDISSRHGKVFLSGANKPNIISTTDSRAMKPVSNLALCLEQVILVDGNPGFLQDPEAVFQQEPFVDTSVSPFRGRSHRQQPFRRHGGERSSETLPQSLMESPVWTGEYVEMCDSIVVVLDK
jgi:hypothetical protein